MLQCDSLETRPPCFSFHAIFNYVNERVETTVRRGFREISKVSLILCLFNMSVICGPLLLYLIRNIQGNVFAMVSVYHKNEIIHA
jgi:hypothetical protein